MQFKHWLEASKGRALAVAKHFRRTKSAVSQWKNNGVPTELMKAIRDYTGGEVTLEEMLPDSSPLLKRRNKQRLKRQAGGKGF